MRGTLLCSYLHDLFIALLPYLFFRHEIVVAAEHVKLSEKKKALSYMKNSAYSGNDA